MMDSKIFACLIVGSRSFTNYQQAKLSIDKMLSKKREEGFSFIIVSGGASGADALAKQYAEEYDYQYIEFPADWERYGRSAGIKRNEQMHQYISQYEHRGCIAFWDGISKGTQHSFTLAEKYHNPLRIIKIGEHNG